MRRKFLAVLLVIAMMFSSVIPSFAVASADQGDSGSDVVFWVEDVTVEPGATEAKVKVHVSGGADKWATSTLFLGTPEGVLSTSFTAGDYIEDPALDFAELYDFDFNADASAISAYNNPTTGATIDFSGSAVWNHIVSYYRDGNSNDNYPGNEGVIVEFTYSLPEGAAEGDVYPIELIADAVYDINNQAVGFKALGGEIKVSAADPLKVSADVKTVEQYDEFTYSVKADENPGFWGMSFNISFDASALELVDVTSSLFEVNVTDRADGALGVVIENSEFADVTATGSIVDFTFKAKAIGEYPVTLSYTDDANIVTVDEKIVPVEMTSGSVTVAECSHSVTHVEVTEPTATSDGVYVVICDKCGVEVSRTIIPSVKDAAISAAAVTVEKCDVFEYAIALDSSTFGVWGLHFDVKFDTAALELLGVSSDNFNIDDDAVVTTADGIKLTLDRDALENVTAPATIVVLKFKAVNEGTYDVNLSAAESGVVDVDENVVTVSFVNGVITVDPCSHPSTTEDRKEPTDTEDGYIKHICDKCGDVVDEVVLPHKKTATIAGETKTVEKCDEFEYAITLDESTYGVWGLHFDVKFDTAALEFLGVSSDNFTIDDDTVVTTADGIKLTLDRDVLENVAAPATVVVLKFKAVTEGAVDVTFSAAEGNIVTVDEKSVETTFVNGVITVDPCSHPSTTEDRKEPTDTEDGYVKHICDKCGDVVDEVVLPHKKTATIAGETKTVEKCDEFEYAITLDESTYGVWGLHFDVKFDTAALELIGVSSDNFTIDDDTVVTTADGIKLTLDRDVLENVAAPATVVVLKFKAVTEGAVDVTFSAAEGNIVTVDEKSVETTFVNGTITVDPCSHNSGTHIDRVEPTETEDGYERVICDKCGEVISETILPCARQATISAEAKTVEKGDEFEYVINLDSTTRGVWGLHFDVKFDTTVLEYVGFTAGAGFNSDSDTVVVTADGLKITLDRDVLENVTEPGALITLKFKAAAEGTVDVALSAAEGNIVTVDEKSVETTFVNGTITVDPCAHNSGTHIDRVEPTETEDGYERVICDKCGEVISETILPCARKATISAETMTVEKGDEFEYVINLDSATRGVWGLHFDVKFDTTVLEYVGFTAGAGFNSDSDTVVVTADGLKITLDRDVLENVTEPGALITLKFKAAAEGTVDVALSAAEGNIVTVDEKSVETTFVNGTITVDPCSHNSGTHIDRVEPTETEDGYERVICDKCGEVISETILPATGAVVITGEDKTVEKGDVFEYVINLDSTTRGVWGLHFDVKFDTTGLEYVAFTSELFDSSEITVLTIQDGLRITVAKNAIEDVSAVGALITLKFKAIAEGNTAVTVDLSEAGIVDSGENIINATVVNGSVTVNACSHPSTHIERVEPTETEYGHIIVVCDKCGEIIAKHILLGDVDLDGDVDGTDVCLIKRYIAGLMELNDIQLITSDADKNGIINGTDLLLIKRHIIELINLGYIENYVTPENVKKKIIFDHDLGSDCDDAAAAAIVIKAHMAGECECLAITHAIGDHYGAYTTKAICEYFGADDIEVGCNRENDKCSTPDYHTCTKYTTEKYFNGRELPDLESNIKILRRIMANNGAKDITLVTTGPLTTIYELYKSGPDEISPKTGRELIQENVAEFVCGAGCFSDPNVREWNLRADMESALEVINNPAMPMTFVGNNVGGGIFTGDLLRDCDENYPVRDCYFLLHNWEDCIRNSWDLVTVYYAIYGGSGYWERLDGYDVRVLENECTYVKEGGIHSYIRQIGDSGEITDLLNRAMMP